MTNCDSNGIRYSYFSFNELADWCNEDLFYGSQARDLSYAAAIEELKAEAEQSYANFLDDAHAAASETDHGMGNEDHAKFIERWFEDNDVEFDEETFVDRYLESKYDSIQIDEPIIEGELDGVHYRISWLGGAPNIWCFSGPLGYAKELCSPCVPGAALGRSDFVLASELAQGQEPEGYLCYCVPRDWLRPEE